MAGILGDSKGPLEALRDFWGERSYQRRTNGDERLSRALSLLWALREDFDLMAKEHGNDDLRVPELESLAKVMAECRAGHAGWDTTKVISSIEAATAVRQNPMVREDDAGTN